MRFLILCTFLLCSLYLSAQSAQKKIDSLLQVAETTNDSVRLRIFNKVSFYYIFNDPPTAKKLLLKGIRESQSKDIPFSEAELTNTYGIYYDVSGKQDSAKHYFEKSLGISKENDYKVITVMIINNLGMFNWNKGNYNEALDYFFSALEMNKNNSSDKGDGTYLNNIGLIYQEMGNYEKALEYHNLSLADRRKYNAQSEIPVSLNNIGICLVAQGKYDEAETILKESIALSKEVNEMGKYFDATVSLGDLYLTKKEYRKAIPLLEEAINGKETYNIDRNSSMIPIAHIIQSYNSLGIKVKALEYVAKGETLLIEFPDVRNSSVDFYKNAAETYFLNGNFEKGSEYMNMSMQLKEEIFSEDNASEIANLETRFKVAEKEADLATTRATLAESELKSKKKNTLIYGALGLALILGLLGYLFYNQQKLKNRQLVKEGELKTALARIETQNRLQEQRLRISRDLHDNIGSQLTFIISSVDTLKFGLQNTPDKTSEKLSNISTFTSETIYELRDTIWAMNKEDITFEDLQVRISNFIEKANTASLGIDFTFEIAEEVSVAHKFSSVEGMNIYRIIQECVNNSIKYAEASEIKIRISQKPETNSIILEISDNGKGFEMDTVQTGNGLASIKKRAREIGGEIKIQSSEKTGTTTQLIIKNTSKNVS